MKVTANSSSDPTAAVSTAGRELLTGVLQRNPLVAVATALLSPILGLFQARRAATICPAGRDDVPSTQIEKLKLEHYRSGPISPPDTPRQQGSSKDPARMPQGSSKRSASRQQAPSKASACRFEPRFGRVAQEGGIHHG